MFVEERMYLLHPGKIPEYYTLYETEGMLKPAPFFKDRLAKMLAAAM